MGGHVHEHFDFSVFAIALFLDIILRRLNLVFDEFAVEDGGEGFEDFEDQANQGKQPFDHDTPLLFIGIFPYA